VKVEVSCKDFLDPATVTLLLTPHKSPVSGDAYRFAMAALVASLARIHSAHKHGALMKTSTFAALGATLAIIAGASAPARAQGQNPPGVNPTHYQCYRVSEANPLKAQQVKLRDQFAASGVKLGKALYLCAPVEKNGVPPKDKDTHLICYSIEGKAANKKVSVTHQFGTQTLTVGGVVSLCVPSIKKVL
jgi:hypothetical protein